MIKKALLWRLTPQNGGPVSYLFGTMHVRDLRAFGWLNAATERLAETEVFATEFDFSETDETALSAALRLPGGQTLDTFLKPRVWKNLDRYCRRNFGTSADTLRYHHPMTVSTILSTAFMSTESAHSLDETLWHHARTLGKTTTGVETFADQLETLRNIPFEQQIKSLTWLLKNFRRQQRRLKKMMQWYMAADIQKLYKAARKDSKGMRRILLYNRNKLMAGSFAAIARERSLFCAVGAGHLAGQKGMLRLLKKAGFTIEALSLSDKG